MIILPYRWTLHVKDMLLSAPYSTQNKHLTSGFLSSFHDLSTCLVWLLRNHFCTNFCLICCSTSGSNIIISVLCNVYIMEVLEKTIIFGSALSSWDNTSLYHHKFRIIYLMYILFLIFQIFNLPMALFIPPSVFAVHLQFNLLYQFWIHTEVNQIFKPYLNS